MSNDDTTISTEIERFAAENLALFLVFWFNVFAVFLAFWGCSRCYQITLLMLVRRRSKRLKTDNNPEPINL